MDGQKVGSVTEETLQYCGYKTDTQDIVYEVTKPIGPVDQYEVPDFWDTQDIWSVLGTTITTTSGISSTRGIHGTGRKLVLPEKEKRKGITLDPSLFEWEDD